MLRQPSLGQEAKKLGISNPHITFREGGLPYEEYVLKARGLERVREATLTPYESLCLHGLRHRLDTTHPAHRKRLDDAEDDIPSQVIRSVN